MMHTVLLILWAFAGFTTELPKEQIYQSYLTSDMKTWKRLQEGLEWQAEHSDDKELLFFLTRTQYGYVGYQLGIDNHDEARVHLKKAKKNAERLLQINPDWAEVYAIKSGLVGYEIALAKYKAPFLGLTSIDYADKAVELNPQCASAWMEKGNIAYFASFLGYGYGKAADYYKKSVQMFEQQNKTEHSWVYLNALAMLAQSYERIEQPAKARATYEKILRLEPGFAWVRDELYPEFLENSD